MQHKMIDVVYKHQVALIIIILVAINMMNIEAVLQLITQPLARSVGMKFEPFLMIDLQSEASQHARRQHLRRQIHLVYRQTPSGDTQPSLRVADDSLRGQDRERLEPILLQHQPIVGDDRRP